MGMDSNTVIGFILLGLLLFVYLYTSTKGSQELQRQKQRYDDSVAAVKAIQDANARLKDTSKNSTVAPDTTGFNPALSGTEKTLVVENEVMKVVFTNRGGQPKQVTLKNYKAFDS